MAGKPVEVPKFLQELHGEKTTIGKILLVYLSGGIVAAFSLIGLVHQGIAPWRVILCGILFMDISGGVVANLSSSTNQYYQKNMRLRIGFLLVHCIHPGLFIVMFPLQYPYFLFCYLYTMIACLALFKVKDADLQQNMAALFVAVGISASLVFFPSPIKALALFGPLFMIKLVLGFSVRRPSY